MQDIRWSRCGNLENWAGVFGTHIEARHLPTAWMFRNFCKVF
jgi:hypothetical protein